MRILIVITAALALGALPALAQNKNQVNKDRRCGDNCTAHCQAKVAKGTSQNMGNCMSRCQRSNASRC
jgi:hypothetical protein